jgi:hypothetical protein
VRFSLDQPSKGLGVTMIPSRLTKRLVERAVDVELTEHLGSARRDRQRSQRLQREDDLH